ncbi:helix-turn-helix transcriptional regulator [Magnetovibrio sp.]|uniref:helix-turn-helix transcriptional regulator n=1 Tax=Magnetovibrio sp. TaxID=2024836 RepID=UPI002F92BCE7
MDNRLTDFLSRLNAATTADEAWEMTVAFMEQMGATSLVYAAGEKLDDYSMYTTTPDWWMERYTEKQYAFHDKQLHHCMNYLNTSFLDLGSLKAQTFDGSAEDKVSLEFSETGIASVVTLPLRLPWADRSFGGMSLACDMSMPELQMLLSENGQIIHLAAMYSHSIIQTLLRNEQAQAAPLSAREKECLLWLARGLNSERIADRLNIARITVDTHIGSAKRKLGAATREHALAMAIQLGIIAP